MLRTVGEMKSFVIFIFLILASRAITQENSTEVILENDLGTIKLFLSGEYDGFQKTFKDSDCGCCCDQIWNIFYSTKHDASPKADSLPYLVGTDLSGTNAFKLTISQPACSDCFIVDEKLTYEALSKSLSIALNEFQDRKFLNSEVIEISNQPFMILSTRDSLNDHVKEEVCATTHIKGQPVDFTFTRIGKGSTNFVDESLKILNTIRIIK
jgi:hypothetical protein